MARMSSPFGRALLLALALLVAGIARAGAADDRTIRIATLKFGTVNWEIDVIARHGFDRDAGIKIEEVELASNQATQVALQAGRVDAMVSDWFFVSRQRSEGADWTFFPFSSALGALIVPSASPIASIADLQGRRLGIAGTPLDKSWLVMRLLARQSRHIDLEAATQKSFGAPPLLAEELARGRLDAVLTFWPSAARLEGQGYRSLLTVGQALGELGIQRPVPMVGYVVSEAWAASHAETLAGFVAASRRARDVLDRSDAEWQRIAPLTQAQGAELEHLRDAFRAGIPRSWGDTERADAARLYERLWSLGGAEAVGPRPSLQPGTFLDAVRY